MADELRKLATTRAELASLAKQRQETSVEIRNVRTTLDRLARQGTPQSERRGLERQLAALERTATRVDERAADVKALIDRLRSEIRLRRPEDSVEELDGQVPVAMFPVRLETRFMDDASELRIRIYPEQIHIDAHEPELTESELTIAEQYWKARWTATTAEERSAAWYDLTRRVRPSRARFLVHATEPTNLDELGSGEPRLPDDIPLRPSAFSRQPVARLLPEQWVAIGFRGGTEVVRKWGRPVTEGIAVGLAPDPDAVSEPADVPDTQDELPIDDTISWLVDYDAAVAAGMAITVTAGALTSGRLSAGFDELVVLGIDWGADPQAAAASIDAQLRRHAFSDGLALLGSGVPTNNTDESRAAPGTDPALDGADFDPATVVPASDAAARAARALGADPASALGVAPARGSLDDGAAGDMNNVLWASTLGAFLDQFMEPIVTSAMADRAHDHFRRYVRGQGPFATLRIGRQPYGVLPVAAGTFATGDDFADQLAARLRGLRTFWDLAVDTVPRLGDSGQPDVDTLELLRHTPRSSTFRFREAFASTVSASIFGFITAGMFQEMISNFVLSLAGITGRPRIARITVDPNQRDVPVPLVDYGSLSETDLLDPDYITAVLTASSTAGGFATLLSEPGKARTLLDALLRQSAAVEYVIGSTMLVLDHELATSVIARLPDHMRITDREVLGVSADLAVGPDSDAPPSLLATAETASDIADAKIAAVSGDRTLANHLAVATNAELRRRITTRRFASFRASLEHLAKLPTAELDRLASSTLDCVSHRLDAWITSAATRRLDAVRDERGTATYIGGFGYVEDLRPRGTPVSRGYLHAPSLGHAATAAVLRSGHLARGGSRDGTFAIDLTSTRVARALDLIDGMRRGQSIGSLLGYRFERSVRDRRLTLAKYILPIRQRTPLAEVATPPDPTAPPVETIAARDVVDGVALLEAWRDRPSVYFNSLSIPVPNADRGDLNELLRELDDLYDAVSDLLVAESVHQAVVGNTERSAAALDALDRQQPLPDLGVLRTPRTATGLSHRLLVVFADDTAAPGWTINDARRAAEPRVDRWCGLVLGDPTRYRFAAEVRDADGTVVETLAAQLPDLGVSAISTVVASATEGAEVSELEQRLALRFGELVKNETAAEIVLLDDPPAGSGVTALGLRDLLDLAAPISDVLASARPADARALLPDTERPTAGVDAAELRTRADDVVAALSSAVTALESLPDDADVADVVAALLAAADAGVPGAVPGADTPSDQAKSIADLGRSALDRVVAAEAGFDRTSADDAGLAAHDLARIRAVLGQMFPVLAQFRVPDPASAEDEDFRASLTASNSDGDLLGEDPLAPSAWVGLHAAVRPSVARLARVLEGAEMLGGRTGLADLYVAQLPHRPGSAWVGLPFDSPPPTTTSWVVHAEARPAFDAPMAAIVVDQWGEAVPSTTETTGVSFHFDAPGARAPQTVLIATPADRNASGWSVAALAATVRDAIGLARIRSLDIDDVEAAARFLPATYLPFNIEAKMPWLNLPAIIAAATVRLNEEFSRSEA
jgi:hypothetical protein